MPINPWLRIGFATWALGAEASMVIGLRLMKLAAGGAAAETEAGRMIGEKVAAAVTLQTRAPTGSLGTNPKDATGKAIAHYRRKVRANRRRLTKS